MRRLWFALCIVASGCTQDSPTTSPADEVAHATHPTHYGVVEVPSNLGGTTSRADSINNRGTLAGFSSLPPGNATRHAAVWHSGSLSDLGTLGGPNSSVVWPGQNSRGTVVGISEMAALDPNGEEWSCSAFFPSVTHHICVGFVSQDGAMTALPTFGGNNGFATGVNDRGQVVGWAETPVHDPSCNAPQVLQFRAAMWEPRFGLMHELPPIGTDETSAATAINERGQAVGISGACDVAVGRFSAKHAVLWDQGTVTDIGNLGGISWNTPMAINDAGDIVGFSNPPGDADGTFNARAFLWTRDHGIQNLGTLPGDDFSEALAVNGQRQVLGLSCGASCRAFLWQDGVLTDLNTLVGPGFPDHLVAAQDINEAGVITGRVLVASSGATLPYVATPVEGP